MRLLLCLLALVAAPVWAEWVLVSETEYTYAFIDPTSIRKDGNMRRVGELYDLKKPYTNGELSRRKLSEYDCKEERSRFISLTVHSEHKGRGEVLAAMFIPTELDDVEPSTINAAQLKFVCAI